MPARHSVLSLKQCCLKRIALTFESFWMQSYNEYFRDLPRILYILGPFDHLTNEMVQDLIDSLVDKACLKKNHVQVLLQESVTKLNLHHIGPALQDSVLQTISIRCPRLTVLDLSFAQVSPRSMCDFLKCIPEIKHLNLSNTKCNDQVLSVIGHNCPKLHHLAINFTPVTDSGLFSLCQAPMDAAGCKQITHLDIRGTTVRLKGALHCLQNLPDIHYLGFDSICDVIAKDIELRRKNGKEAKIYKFREICDDFLGTKPDSILSVCQWCPYVCKAVFTSGITDENFKAMSALKHLRTLHICSSGSNAVTFTAGVLSLLKDIGHQLEDFMLVDVDFVDLTAIGMYCKNMASLTLWTQDQTESHTNAIDLQGLNLFPIYKKLTSCVICMNPNFGPGKLMTGLSVLLKAALLLQRLSLSYMETLTSDVFMDVLNFNQLSHLEAACFPSCPNLGPDVVVRLLQGSNQLQKLDLTHCEKITRKNYEEFKAFVALNNFKLDISWI